MQNAPGLIFIVAELVKHLVNLLFVNALFIFVLRKRTKSGAEYNIKLIGQPTNYFKLTGDDFDEFVNYRCWQAPGRFNLMTDGFNG